MTLSINQQQNWLPSVLSEPSKQVNQPQSQELALVPPSDASDDKEFTFFGDDGFSFGDLVDIVNPLQHIPVVSTFYRDATGDEIAPASRVMGSTLFFGPLGLAGALANVVIEENTGMDIGEHMASWVHSDDETNSLAFNNADPSHASGSQPLDPNDPVIAWARQEHDWTRQKISEQEKTPRSKPAHQPFPDAAPLVKQDQPWASLQEELASAVVLSADSRSASWAYEAAANLHTGGRG